MIQRLRIMRRVLERPPEQTVAEWLETTEGTPNDPGTVYTWFRQYGSGINRTSIAQVNALIAAQYGDDDNELEVEKVKNELGDVTKASRTAREIVTNGTGQGPSALELLEARLEDALKGIKLRDDALLELLAENESLREQTRLILTSHR